MAIVKNTAKSAPVPAKAVEKKSAAKATAKPAAKTAPAAKAKPAPAPKVKAAPKADAPETSLVTEKLTRKDLALAIRTKVMATGAAISEKVAEICAVAYEEAIAEALTAHKQVSLTGFGIFSVSARDAREATNPQDPAGPKVHVAACIVPKFKPGSKLKAAVNGGTADAGDE